MSVALLYCQAGECSFGINQVIVVSPCCLAEKCMHAGECKFTVDLVSVASVRQVVVGV